MIDQQERTITPTDEVARPETMNGAPRQVETSVSEPSAQMPHAASAATVEAEDTAGSADQRWQVRAGREGARRVHQLIQEGKLYEQEHGLKRGRQRLRQLIELGKLYEQEHGLRPSRPKKRGEQLSRMGREELVATFLQCLLRIAKPSFRAELTRLAEALQQEENGHAA